MGNWKVFIVNKDGVEVPLGWATDVELNLTNIETEEVNEEHIERKPIVIPSAIEFQIAEFDKEVIDSFIKFFDELAKNISNTVEKLAETQQATNQFKSYEIEKYKMLNNKKQLKKLHPAYRK